MSETKVHTISIKEQSLNNSQLRKVLFTDKNQQLVAMSIPAGSEIGQESHANSTQFIRVEKGRGTAVIGEKKKGREKFKLKPGDSITIPAGVFHNIKNNSKKSPLQLSTIYSPPVH